MKQKIKLISEAYSMQPVSFCVANSNKDKYGDEEITEIKEELIHASNGDYLSVYVGYNHRGEKKFMYLVNACNVHYF